MIIRATTNLKAMRNSLTMTLYLIDKDEARWWHLSYICNIKNANCIVSWHSLHFAVSGLCVARVTGLTTTFHWNDQTFLIPTMEWYGLKCTWKLSIFPLQWHKLVVRTMCVFHILRVHVRHMLLEIRLCWRVEIRTFFRDDNRGVYLNCYFFYYIQTSGQKPIISIFYYYCY